MQTATQPDTSLTPAPAGSPARLSVRTLRRLLRDAGRLSARLTRALRRSKKNGPPAAAEVEPAPAAFAAWDESQHPRGQPENKGEFAPKGGGRGKAKGRAAPAEAGVGPSGRPLFRDRTREAVDAALAAGRTLPDTFGNPYDPASPAGAGMHKVYLADLHDAVGAGLDMPLEEFKRRLLQAHLAGQVQLLRDDIGNTLSAENAAKSARSEVTHLGATFHALNVAWRPPAAFAAEAPASFTPWAQEVPA